jgi:alanine dehydrogenase
LIEDKEMIIGVLKEKDGRAILVPSDIKLLSDKYDIIFESGLGDVIGFSDLEYINSGAVCLSKQEVWAKSDLLFKYKAPTSEEHHFFSEGKIIFSLMHPEGNPKLLRALNDVKMTSYSFEYFKTKGDIFPLAACGGEIAGSMAVMYANHYLQSIYGGLGKSLFRVAGAMPSKVLVIGSGHVGSAAIRTLLNLGSEVYVTARDYYRLKKISQCFGSNLLRTVKLKSRKFYELLKEVDVILGAILVSTDETEAILEKDSISKMKSGSVIVDITCGYGRGYLPSISQKTSLLKPVELTDTGQLYIKIDNLPSAYPRTSSEAYSHQLLEFFDEIISHINYQEYSSLVDSGKITDKGKTVHSGVIHDLNFIGEVSG